jgi:hypothetical protein
LLLLLPARTEQAAAGPLWREGDSAWAVADSARLADLAARFPDGIIPLWALRQDAPIVPTGAPDVSTPVSPHDASDADGCGPPIIEISLGDNHIAHHFDPSSQTTEVYVSDNATLQYRFDAELNYTIDTIPGVSEGPWLAVDLDRDGNVELVTQHADILRIRSAPDWTVRDSIQYPGMATVMNPIAINVDADEYLELCVTPVGFFFDGFLSLIKYNSAADSFEEVSRVMPPNGAIGRPAAGDFDSDGRVEFISGNFITGYDLIEWQDTGLVYIGHVGDTLPGNNYSAIECRPKPDGLLYALAGHSGTDGWTYQLLKPVGDNDFVVDRRFSAATGFTGIHSVGSGDTDCDGLDELAMRFYPDYQTWKWDMTSSDFVVSCAWNKDQVGTIEAWYSVDLDQNGTPEWGILSLEGGTFRSYPSSSCHVCDTLGRCQITSPWCFCPCAGDPVCDQVTDVFDVVQGVDVAFRAQPAPYSLNCPRDFTDINCDGVTNVFDVVGLVDVAFRSGDPAVLFCNPCPLLQP